MALRYLSTSMTIRHSCYRQLSSIERSTCNAPAALQSQIRRCFASTPRSYDSNEKKDASTQEKASGSTTTKASESEKNVASKPSSSSASTLPPPADWEENPDFSISTFAELPHSNFGVNQHMLIDDEFKKALRDVCWQFRAPIRYAFAYGSGVFPQSKAKSMVTPSTTTSVHSNAPAAVQKAQGGNPKMIDFIFGVSYSQHWHSLNLHEHRDHYSALGSLGSYTVSRVQDDWGAGVYFNPYVQVNGMQIKYGVVNLDTLCTDLSTWSTLYTAGRLQKPVKILRDDARVRLANQVNLISALRTALLLLPTKFTEMELYGTIASISYMGDPRMSLPTENPNKVANIVGNNLPNFRRLYGPLIENLPNVSFNDPQCLENDWMANPDTNVKIEQDMEPIKRGNMVRRLPSAFRQKLYFQYQQKYQIPQLEFNKMLEATTDDDMTSFKRREGGAFERRIASEPAENLRDEVRKTIKKTIGWPSTSQSIKGIFTGGLRRTYKYMSEKMAKHKEGSTQTAVSEKKSS